MRSQGEGGRLEGTRGMGKGEVEIKSCFVTWATCGSPFLFLSIGLVRFYCFA